MKFNYINSLVPGRCGSDFESVISAHMSQIKSLWALLMILLFGECHRTPHDKSPLVLVIPRANADLYLCRPYVTTRPQWVKAPVVHGNLTWFGLGSLVCHRAAHSIITVHHRDNTFMETEPVNRRWPLYAEHSICTQWVGMKHRILMEQIQYNNDMTLVSWHLN